MDVPAPTGATRGGGNQGVGSAGGYVAFYAARAGEPEFEAAGFGIGGTRGALDPLDRRASVSIYRWRLDGRAAVQK